MIEERQFPKVDDSLVRDIQIIWYEDKHILAVQSVLRPKTFYDRHPIISGKVVGFINLFMNLIFLYAIWQHDIMAMVAAVLLGAFWSLAVKRRIEPPKSRIEYQ